jgi:xylulokinase
VPVRKDGKILGNCILVSDKRAQKEATYIGELEEYKALSHYLPKNCDTSQMIPKAVWWKKINEDLVDFSEVMILSPNDLFAYEFSGQFVTDVFNAQKCFYDWKSKSYPEYLIKTLDLDSSQFPKVVPVGTSVGVISESAARKFNLTKNCEYIVTTYDAICGFWGSGASDVGEASDVSGTVTSLRVLVQNEHLKELKCQNLFYAPVNSQVGIIGGSNNMGGGLIEWARDLYFANEQSPYHLMEDEAKKSCAGARGLIFLPYLMGERAPLWNQNARGVFFGIERYHTRADFARAVFDSAGFSLLNLINEIESLGIAVGPIKVSGGLSRISLISQIKADITNREIHVVDNLESTAMGAFLLMGVAKGYFSDIKMASKALSNTREIIYPNPKRVKEYREIFRLQNILYERVKPVFELRSQILSESFSNSILENGIL